MYKGVKEWEKFLSKELLWPLSFYKFDTTPYHTSKVIEY
jgi:hypothetical protein